MDKIEELSILNWTAPGDRFWDKITAKPDEQSLHVRFTGWLTPHEYHALCEHLKGEPVHMIGVSNV